MSRKTEYVICPTCGTKITASRQGSGNRCFTTRSGSGAALDWMAGPDKDMNWFQACQWIDSLDENGWRMPSVKELKILEQSSAQNLSITGWWIWSKDKDGPLSAKGLDISKGEVYSGGRELDSGGRVFAVREVKK